MKRSLSIVYAGMIALMATLPALAQQTGTAPPPDYMYHRHMMWHGGFFGPLLMVIVIFALVALFMRLGWWGHRGHRYHRMGAVRSTFSKSALPAARSTRPSSRKSASS
jgi:hypothetical protein